MPNCRFCGEPLSISVADLGMSPLANSYVPKEKENSPEVFYPLHAYVCEKCFLVQLEEFQSAENIFSDYSYFSSYSDSWLSHCRRYADLMVSKGIVDTNSSVVEIASNDGYLLQFFKEKGISVLGVEPAKNVAVTAEQKGIHTVTEFFGTALGKKIAEKYGKADLLIGNNVLAHVPDINDFVEGLKQLLAPTGTITIEFPHLLNLIQFNQFDTIYHEHFSYLSLYSVSQIFQAHGLDVYDVEQLPTHGGSLRIYACHCGSGKLHTQQYNTVLDEEKQSGLQNVQSYQEFYHAVLKTKRQILSHLIALKDSGKKIAAYGAPAKGNTLLNFCGISKDFIDFTVDRNPVKQNTLLPGSHIPVYSVEKLLLEKPDYIVILPWNLKDEIIEQLSSLCDWNVKFITLIPEVRIYGN